MKFLLTITSLVASALSMDAQVAATLNRSIAGSIEIRVRNNSTKNLTAAAVKISRATDSASAGVSLQPEIVYLDTAIDTAAAPVAANQERPFPAHLLARGPRPLPAEALSRG